MLTSCLLAYTFFLYFLFFLQRDRQFHHHLNENVVFVRQHSRFSLNDSFSLCFFFPSSYTHTHLFVSEGERERNILNLLAAQTRSVLTVALIISFVCLKMSDMLTLRVITTIRTNADDNNAE